MNKTMSKSYQTSNGKTPLLDYHNLKAGRGYWLVMAGLVGVIVVAGVNTSKQTQERHAVYRQLMKAREHARELKIEEQMLIIEQQTFSATPIVAKRAVAELGMFYPAEKDKLIIVNKTDTP